MERQKSDWTLLEKIDNSILDSKTVTVVVYFKFEWHFGNQNTLSHTRLTFEKFMSHLQMETLDQY